MREGTDVTAKTIGELTAEIREINIAKGWRPAGRGPGTNTWGDYVALLHSEISEALEAYRDHRLADATKGPRCADSRCDRFLSTEALSGDIDFPHVAPCPPEHLRPSKPEGVGSELADVLIRLLDMCDVFGVWVAHDEAHLSDVDSAVPIRALEVKSFGDHLAWLHHRVSVMWFEDANAGWVLWALVTTARRFAIDLDAEVERKIAYNRTRSYQHGGRTLAVEKETKNG